MEGAGKKKGDGVAALAGGVLADCLSYGLDSCGGWGGDGIGLGHERRQKREAQAEVSNIAAGLRLAQLHVVRYDFRSS